MAIFSLVLPLLFRCGYIYIYMSLVLYITYKACGVEKEVANNMNLKIQYKGMNKGENDNSVATKKHFRLRPLPKTTLTYTY